jgi:hypothetical protein
MRTNQHFRRGVTLVATAALLTITACAPAATASSGGTRSVPGAGRHTPRGGADVETAATTPGWRVVKRTDVDRRPVGGLLSVISAKDAWVAWTGSEASIEHWTRGAWRDVTMPPKVAADLLAADVIGADSEGDVWVLTAFLTNEAIRRTGAGKWLLQPIPPWVVRVTPYSPDPTVAVFGPRNVWVFSLGVGGAYAAHYDGHAWAKVKMPQAPVEVSAVAWNDMWALGSDIGFVMHWNGVRWVKVALPVLPLPFGATVSYSNITGVGPQNAWLMRTISYKSGHVPSTAMMHWNGRAWLTIASPADVVGSLVPDGNGGLWAVGADLNPSGFWFFYHLVRGHWTQFTPPGVVLQHEEELAWIPGTRSMWATGIGLNSKGFFYGVMLKYGP